MSDQSAEPAGQAPGSTPTAGSAGPVQLDPNTDYIVPGYDTPLKGAQVKDGILMQADYTRKTQEAAEIRRQAETLYNQSAAALEVVQLLSENNGANFDEAVETLREAWGLKPQGSPQPPTPAPTQQTGQSQMPNEDASAIRAELEQTKNLLFQYMATNQLEREMAGVSALDKTLGLKFDDPAVRSRVINKAAQSNIPIEDAYKAELFNDLLARVKDAESEKQAAEMRRFIPSLGGGSREAQNPKPADPTEALRTILERKLREKGYVSS